MLKSDLEDWTLRFGTHSRQVVFSAAKLCAISNELVDNMVALAPFLSFEDRQVLADMAEKIGNVLENMGEAMILQGEDLDALRTILISYLEELGAKNVR